VNPDVGVSDVPSGRDEAVSDNLRSEHRRILEVVGVLERILDIGPSAWDLAALDGCLEFFRLFTDACHHGKEEDVLFPELVNHGMPSHQGPIAVMLHEHRIGRALVARMGDGLESLRGESGAGADELETAGREYVELIRAHIMKEDHVLFEMADGLVRGPACQRVCRTYHEICSRRFDGRTHADLEALAERLLAAHPPD